MKSQPILDWRSTLIQTLCVGLLAILFLVGFQYMVSGEWISSTYFSSLTSDSMMQTVPIAQLRNAPFESLYYLHIQPPLFDAIRAFIASFSDRNIVNEDMLIRYVDVRLHQILIALFGILSALIFCWVKLATRSTIFAGVVTLGWVFYPTPIFLSTLLDGTLLSAVFITWMLFELWLIFQGFGHSGRLSVAVLLCCFTRSFFQWYFMPILLLSLFLLGMKLKKIVFVSLFLALGFGSYVFKQYSVFGVTSTSTFSGQHMAGVLWIEEANPSGGLIWTGIETDSYREMINQRKAGLNKIYPRKAYSYSGGYNTKDQWQLNFIHSSIAKSQCASSMQVCVSALWKSFRQNWPEYWYVEGWGASVVDNLPDWYKINYFRLSTRYLWFLGLATFLFLLLQSTRLKKKDQFYKCVGLILVPGFIFGICIFGNRFDWYEGGRMKFFLEPVYFVFISSQIYLFFSRFWGRKE